MNTHELRIHMTMTIMKMQWVKEESKPVETVEGGWGGDMP